MSELIEDELMKLEQLANDPVLGVQEQGDVLTAVLDIRMLRIKLDRVRAYALALEASSSAEQWRDGAIAKELLSILGDVDPHADIWPCKCDSCTGDMRCATCGVAGGEVCKTWCPNHPSKHDYTRSHGVK